MNNKTTPLPRRVIRIVLTGGVAAGKSQILQILREHLRDSGMPVAYVKECATELLERGYTPERWGNVAFQHTVFRHQLENENRAFRRMLPKSRETGNPVVLFCDRGLGDGGAYLPPETFGTICRSFGYSRKRLLGRYQTRCFWIPPPPEAIFPSTSIPATICGWNPAGKKRCCPTSGLSPPGPITRT